MIYYYLIATLLAAINLILLVCTYENKKVNYYFILSMLIMAVANFGYLVLSLSTGLGEAVFANKIGYIGGCFIPLVTLFLICTICNYHIPNWLHGVLCGYSFLVYFMVLTIGYSDFYYRDLSLGKLGNATILIHEYGIGHIFFEIILYGYLIAEVVLLGHQIFKKRAVAQNKLLILSVMVISNIVFFVIGRMVVPDLEIMPALYVVDGWLLLYLQKKSMLYNLEDSIASTIQTQEVYGYIMFDNEQRYMGSNKVAQRVFPEILECKVDHKLNGTGVVKELSEWLRLYMKDGEDTHRYSKADLYYEIKISRVRYGKKARGYVFEIKDETDRLKYMSLLSNYNNELLEKVNERTTELREQQKRTKELFLQTVTALSEAVDAKDRYTSGHSKRVAEYARMIAARLGKSKEEQDEIYRAGLLHDVGKIRIPVEIINKAGKLTDEEFNIIKIHPVTGYHILRDISGSEQIAIAAKYHHERFDGRGYPNGLAGENIPEVARILGVADSYDAMTSNRSYRNALPQEVVKEEIIKGRGTQFDAEIADIMLQLMEEDKDYNMRQSDSFHRKILIADDEVINHTMLRDIMKDEPQYEITAVSSGKDVLRALNREKYDLILLDTLMPDMNGLDTLIHIRKLYDIPVVLMSGNQAPDMVADFRALGCNDYITKPFLPLLIKEVVHNMTERTQIG